MKYLIPLMFIFLESCNHDNFVASEFNKKLIANNDYVWFQNLPKEVPDEYNLIIDDALTSIQYYLPPAGVHDLRLVSIYAPYANKVYDFDTTELSTIIQNEGQHWPYKFKVWSQTISDIRWSNHLFVAGH